MGGQGWCISWRAYWLRSIPILSQEGRIRRKAGLESHWGVVGWLAASLDLDWPGRETCSGPGRRVLFGRVVHFGDDAGA